MNFINELILNVWKLWVVIGILFVILEMANAGTFALFFFGVGAFTTAGVCYHYPIVATNTIYQLLLFAGMSLLSIWVFRPMIKINSTQQKGDSHVADLVGKKARVSNDIEKGKQGSVLFMGTEWTAELAEGIDVIIAKGTEVIVTEIDGVRLKVKL